MITSLPSSPQRTSRPAPPSIVSLPASPLMMSLPGVPTIESLPGVPRIVWLTLPAPRHSLAGSWSARTDEAPALASSAAIPMAMTSLFMIETVAANPPPW